MSLGRPIPIIDIPVSVGCRLEDVVRMDRWIFLEDQGDRLVGSPSRPTDNSGLARYVVILVRLQRDVPILLRAPRNSGLLRLRINTAPSSHKRIAPNRCIRKRTTSRVRPRDAESASGSEVTETKRVGIRKDRRDEQLARRYRRATLRAARDQNAVVMRKKDRLVTTARRGLIFVRGR